MEVNLQRSAVNAAAMPRPAPPNSHSWLPAPQLLDDRAREASRHSGRQNAQFCPGDGKRGPAHCRRRHPSTRIVSGTGASTPSSQPTPHRTEINMVLSLCAQMSSLRVSAQRVSLWHRITCSLPPPQPPALAQRSAHLAVPVLGAPGGLPPRTSCLRSSAQVVGTACIAAGGAHCRALALPPPSACRRPSPLPQPRAWPPRPTASQQPPGPSWRSRSSSSSPPPPLRSRWSAPTAPAA
jgi:hypothetical protein